MSADEFQQLWRAYDAKLEMSRRLNLRLLKDLQRQKVDSVLRRIIRGGAWGIFAGVGWEMALAALFWTVRTQPVMAVSFAVFFICTGIGIASYIRDIAVISSIDYSDDVVQVQQRLASLRSRMVGTLRIMWLQLPFWSTFFVSNKMIREGLPQFLGIVVPVFVLLLAVAIFLYRNITVENAQRKKWVAAFIRGSGAGSVARAIGLLGEIEEFQQG